jgi:diketogulonate reductase-like aldo/keto reductase
MQYTNLHNGVRIPMMGLGVYDMYHEEAESAVRTALELGYRLIDTASLYRNEAEVGRAVRQSGVPRSEIFLTTKVGNADHGYDQTMRAFEASLLKLEMDYIDLYLVHWPVPGKRKETWKALEKLYAEQQVRAIGVANYLLPFLDELETYAQFRPMVNQVEFSPFLFSRDLYDRCRQDQILLQAYTPLVRGRKFQDPRLLQMAEKYGRTPAQIILRWDIELGVCPIPKSVSRERLQENLAALDVRLQPADVNAMKTWNEDFRVCEDPMDFL